MEYLWLYMQVRYESKSLLFPNKCKLLFCLNGGKLVLTTNYTVIGPKQNMQVHALQIFSTIWPSKIVEVLFPRTIKIFENQCKELFSIKISITSIRGYIDKLVAGNVSALTTNIVLQKLHTIEITKIYQKKSRPIINKISFLIDIKVVN